MRKQLLAQADALVNVLSVNKGNIITPGGMSYRVLALDPNSRYMSLPVLRNISEMVKAGAVVVGDKPPVTLSLRDGQIEFKKIANHLWKTVTGVNTFGKGSIYAGQTIAEILASNRITPDFEYTKPMENTELLFVHRKLDDIEIYWVKNRNNDVENPEATFRTDGKLRPEDIELLYSLGLDKFSPRICNSTTMKNGPIALLL